MFNAWSDYMTRPSLKPWFGQVSAWAGGSDSGSLDLFDSIVQVRYLAATNEKPGETTNIELAIAVSYVTVGTQ